jgi:hypothetical protein
VAQPGSATNRYRDASKKCMGHRHNQDLETELLVEVKRAEATFLCDSDRCRERHDGSFGVSMKASARKFRNALRRFSDLILKGKLPKKHKAA